MAEKKGYSSNFYAGADYGMSNSTNDDFAVWEGAYKENIPASSFAFTTDPRTINQLKAVSDKLSTGAKGIEVQGTSPQVLDAIPKQHFKEINRLKKLVGTDLTFHGPLIEPSGWGEGGWTETAKHGAERQMFSAVAKAHELDPGGNVIVTFHSANSLPELEQKEFIMKDGKRQRVTTELIVYDEREGQATRVRPKQDFLYGKEPDPKESLREMNEDRWRKELSQTSFHALQGADSISDTQKIMKQNLELTKGSLNIGNLTEIYKKSKTEAGQKEIQSKPEHVQKAVREIVDRMNYGEVYVREAYNSLKGEFNKAWVAVNKSGSEEDLKALKRYRDKLRTSVPDEKEFNNPDNLVKFARVVQDGVNVLNTIKAPESFRPMNEFLKDQSSDTFANIAFNSFQEFKENSPIISIENPPAGGALSKGEDLRDLVKQSQKKFADRAVKELGMSESEAKNQAEKLIGVTWDVGHINMLKKYGYKDSDLAKQTEAVAPLVKHIHLSDNFGFEHTELPMGMGDVPMQKHKAALEKYGKQLSKLKQVVETGGAWFEQFKVTPFRETLRAFGSPVYAMQMSPYWNQATNASGGYFAGYGAMLPDQHFQTYGAGFSNLPTELGGQMSGRNRLSGSPME